MFVRSAIVLHIAERTEVLLSRDAGARARATQWLVAARNPIEPHFVNAAVLGLFDAEQE